MIITAKRWAAAAALVVLLAAAAWAADANATGKWTWTVKFGDNEVMQSVELKQDGEKLTGTFTGRNNSKSEVKDGKIDKDGNLSFYVTREINGEEIKINYKGKLKDADHIEGKASLNLNGEDRTFDWNPVRAKA